MANNRHWKGAHEISEDHEVSKEITGNEDIDKELGEAYPVPPRPYIIPDSVKSIAGQPRKRAKLQNVGDPSSSLSVVDCWGDASVEASTSNKGSQQNPDNMEEPDLSEVEIICLDDRGDMEMTSGRGGFVVNGTLEPDEDQFSTTSAMEVEPGAAVGPSCNRDSDDDSNAIALSSDEESNYETFEDEIAVIKVKTKAKSRVLSPMTPDNTIEGITERNNEVDDSVCVECIVKDQGLVPQVFRGYVKEFIDDRPNKLGILFSRECGEFII